jgi:L-rhamnose mutarotase
MLRSLLFGLATLAVVAANPSAFGADKPAPDTRLYEMRIYTAAAGKFEALHARFRNHTVKLLEKHGITSVGYWVPVDPKVEMIYFVLAYKDRADRDAKFKAFMDDPEWKKTFADSEKDGKLVDKVEQHFLTTTDYSPALKIGKANAERVFELRTYTATEGNLDGLNARFRNHTLKLFEKHGMTNFVYWNLAAGEKNEKLMLIYLLAHKSVDAAKTSFDNFRKDPDWVAARTESEKKAGGSLTAAKDGVKSVFLKATDYSPTK